MGSGCVIRELLFYGYSTAKPAEMAHGPKSALAESRAAPKSLIICADGFPKSNMVGIRVGLSPYASGFGPSPVAKTRLLRESDGRPVSDPHRGERLRRRIRPRPGSHRTCRHRRC